MVTTVNWAGTIRILAQHTFCYIASLPRCACFQFSLHSIKEVTEGKGVAGVACFEGKQECVCVLFIEKICWYACLALHWFVAHNDFWNKQNKAVWRVKSTFKNVYYAYCNRLPSTVNNATRQSCHSKSVAHLIRKAQACAHTHTQSHTHTHTHTHSHMHMQAMTLH